MSTKEKSMLKLLQEIDDFLATEPTNYQARGWVRRKIDEVIAALENKPAEVPADEVPAEAAAAATDETAPEVTAEPAAAESAPVAETEASADATPPASAVSE